MISKLLVPALLAATAAAMPGQLHYRQANATATAGAAAPPTTAAPAAAGSVNSYSGNPFEGVTMWANSYYASQVSSLAVPKLSGDKAAKAAAVAKVPSFMWLDTIAKIPKMADALADIRKANQAGGKYAGIFVVYDLPDRDCAAAASNGELSIASGGADRYKSEYIAGIKKLIQQYSDIRIILVIEPDSLANMVTNMGVAKCSGAATTYKTLTVHAIKELALPNVGMYLDAGHAGWLGWPANLQPAATLFAQIYKDAGSPKAVRGLATNVANYNAWKAPSAASYTSPNPNYDESMYVAAIGPLLTSAGFPAKFITDQGRSGKQPTGQKEWGDWCNQKGTGFGTRPTTNTGIADLDAFVWIKPGGECDGTSDTTAARYDVHCSSANSMTPAPEAGTWFQEYFEMLLDNANPPF